MGTVPAHLLPFEICRMSKRISKLEERIMDKRRKQRYLYIDGQAVPVSEQVYQAFWHYTNKEDYFMRQLKTPRHRTDQKTQTVLVISARECSLDEMLAAGQQFVGAEQEIEDLVLSGIWLEELLMNLTQEEQEIVRLFYIQGKTERAASAALGLPKSTFRRHEQRLREKLGKLLKNYL